MSLIRAGGSVMRRPVQLLHCTASTRGIVAFLYFKNLPSAAEDLAIFIIEPPLSGFPGFAAVCVVGMWSERSLQIAQLGFGQCNVTEGGFKQCLNNKDVTMFTFLF